MADQSGGKGWWLASDGRWYPPERTPDWRAAALDLEEESGEQQPTLVLDSQRQPANEDATGDGRLASSAARHGKDDRRTMQRGPLLRRVGFVVLAVAAVLVFVLVDGTDEDFSAEAEASSALLDGRVNESNADSAPQQQVVNGWVARDLLEVLARAEDHSSEQQGQQADRLAALALIAVLAICWHGLTASPSSPVGEQEAAITASTEQG